MNGTKTLLKTPLKISEIMKGVPFHLASESLEAEDDFGNDLFWSDITVEDPDKYKSPCSSSFEEWKKKSTEVADGVFKWVKKEAPAGATAVDLPRSRVVYHRNCYTEKVEHPFDSTYLNGNAPDTICVPMKIESNLIGFMEAIGSMKEGEHSIFIISYKKMFGELGCPKRVPMKADILCEILVLKVEHVGEEAAIKQLMNNKAEKFSEIKKSIGETFDRASDTFSNSKYDKAIKLYKLIIQTASLAEPESEEEVEELNSYLKRAHTNVAICYLKKQEWSDVLVHIGILETMGSIGDQVKALHAKGRALMKLGDNTEARKALIKAQQLKRGDPQINECIEELAARQTAYNDFNDSFAKNLKLK